MGDTAILLMGYGSPTKLEELEEYLSGIVPSGKPSTDMISDFRERYMRIGGISPMNSILSAQTLAFSKELRTRGYDLEVYLGTKHWKPSVTEALRKIEAGGYRRIVAFALSPYDSYWIMSSYERAIKAAMAEVGKNFELSWVRGWNTTPKFIEFWSRSVTEAMNGKSQPLLFSAHSLPSKMLQYRDSYPEEVRKTSRMIAERVNPPYWEFAYQSAGDESDMWLKPDVKERMQDYKAKGFTCIVLASIGFIFEHLEVLYDLDVIAKERANSLGIELRRARQPNDDPLFIGAMADALEEGIDWQHYKN